MRLLIALLPAFAYVGIVGCAAEDPGSPPSQASDTGDDGSGGATGGGLTASSAANNNTSAATTSPTSNAASAANTANAANGTSSSTSTNGGPLGPTSAGPTSGGPTTGGGVTSGGPTTGGGVTSGGPTTGGFTTGGFTTGGPATVGGPTTGGAGGASGVTTATTGSSTTGGVPADPDCNAAMPSGGTPHSGNSRGGSGNLAWEIWSNTGEGELDTYEGVAAFRASWNNAGGYLGRMGFEWGNSGPPHTEHGRIYAQFVANKMNLGGDNTNGGGQYSYVGMYGWTLNPCVEWYVVEDTFKTLPFNPGGTVDKGTIEVNGGTYQVYTRDTTGTGGSRCSGVNNWIQYYSIRTSPRSCGVISLSDHFDAWESLGMSMAGNLTEAKILAEVGGEVGAVEFPVANVTTTQ